jgi:glycosyltransferase involved in cell wall biosynthesis
METRKPLVSVCIPNYNYGYYLRNCLDSVVNQTYDNIELIVQDNNSSDDSFDILREYEDRSRRGEIKTYVNVCRNKRNIGSDGNVFRVYERSEGKYIIYLSSDDAIRPEMIERCVGILEKNQNVGMVMVHRDEVDENGNVTKTPPFYDRDFIADRKSQAAVFMVAGIAVPSQSVFRRESMAASLRYHNYQFQVAGDWYTNFCMSLVSDIAYIREPLCEYRVHSGNETNESEKKLLNIFEHYMLVNAMNTTAMTVGYDECTKRYTKSVEKLGNMCLRYSMKMIKAGEDKTARRYLYLAPVFKEEIKDDDRYKRLWEILDSEDNEGKEERIAEFDRLYNLDRTGSYPPPDVFWPIDYNGNIVEDIKR